MYTLQSPTTLKRLKFSRALETSAFIWVFCCSPCPVPLSVESRRSAPPQSAELEHGLAATASPDPPAQWPPAHRATRSAAESKREKCVYWPTATTPEECLQKTFQGFLCLARVFKAFLKLNLSVYLGLPPAGPSDPWSRSLWAFWHSLYPARCSKPAPSSHSSRASHQSAVAFSTRAQKSSKILYINDQYFVPVFIHATVKMIIIINWVNINTVRSTKVLPIE